MAPGNPERGKRNQERKTDLSEFFPKEKLNKLPESRKKIISKLLECFEKLKSKVATEKDKEYIERLFEIIGASEQSVIITDLEQYGNIQLDLTYQKLNQALNDLYLLLLTSVSKRDIDLKTVLNEIRAIHPSDFERIMKIWKSHPKGIVFYYGDEEIKNNAQSLEARLEGKQEEQRKQESESGETAGTTPEGEKKPEYLETLLKQTKDEGEAMIETEKGFISIFKPDPIVWKSIYESEWGQERAELGNKMLNFILKFRQLTERLSKINLPKEIRNVILAKDEEEENKRLRKLSEEDQNLVRTILDIKKNLLSLEEMVLGIGDANKDFSANQLEELGDVLDKFEDSLNKYEQAIENLEKTYGTKYEQDDQIAQSLLGRISEKIKNIVGPIGSSIGLWGLALGWFLPLWLVTKMDEAIEKRFK
jgi:hypothetical protein